MSSVKMNIQKYKCKKSAYSFLHSLATMVCCYFKKNYFRPDEKGYPIDVLICLSKMGNEVEHTLNVAFLPFIPLSLRSSPPPSLSRGELGHGIARAGQ